MGEYVPGIDEDIIDPVYDYIYGNTFNASQKQTIKTLKRLARIDKKISNIGEAGWDKYNKLDKNVQDLLRWYTNGERSYLEAPKPWWQKTAMDIGKGLLNFNPIGLFFNAAVQYGKGLNTVFNVGMQMVENDANPFDANLWANSYHNGESLYNTEIDKQLEERYGKKKAFIAKQFLAGNNIAETIANSPYGYSEEFIKELIDFETNNNEWQNTILEDYRQAKISPGRFAARFLVGERGNKNAQGILPTVTNLGGAPRVGGAIVTQSPFTMQALDTSNMTQEEKDKAFTAVSGTVDFLTQIFADPLTYVTFGAGGAIKFLGKPVNEVARVVELSSQGTGGIRKAFEISAKLRQTWDGFGGMIKRYKDADGPEAKAAIREEMRISYPQLATDESVAFNLENGVFDAETAKEVYSSVNNVSKILSGRVDGTDFFRESIFVHRGRRELLDGARRFWYKIGSQDIQSAQDEVITFTDELKEYGSATMVGKSVQTPQAIKFLAERKKFLKKAATWISRAPGDQGIALGPGQDQTLGTVRALFRIVAPRNIADIAVQEFRIRPISEQIMILRGLYRGIMESYGLPEPKIRAILEESFGSAEKPMGVDPSNLNPWTGKVNSYFGAALDRDLSMMVGALPWNQIQAEAANASLRFAGKTGSEKYRAFNLLGGVVNNSLSTGIVRYWTLGGLFPKLGMRSAIDEIFFFSLYAPSYVMKEYFKAKRLTNFSKTMTGDEQTTGAISLLTRKFLVKVTGNKSYNPSGAFTKEERLAIMDDVMEQAREGKWSESQTMVALMHAYAWESIYKVGKGNLTRDEVDYAFQALVHNSNFLEAASSSVARATSTGGLSSIDSSIKINILDDPSVARMLDDHSVELSKSFRVIEPKELTDTEKAINQYMNTKRLFVDNRVGKSDMGEVFIKHNGLKTVNDYEKAVDEVMASLSPDDIQYLISSRANVWELINIKGLTPDDAVKAMVENIFSQMHFIFHGSNELGAVNYSLLNHIKSSPSVKEGLRIDFDEYFDLAKDNLINQNINTNIMLGKEFDGSMADYWKIAEESLWRLMDRTVTDLFRNKAVSMWYLAKRKELAVVEKELLPKNYLTFRYDEKVLTDPRFKKLVKHKDHNQIMQLAQEDLNALSAGVNIKDVLAAKRALDLTQKQMTETAMHTAVNMTLKYVDNPHVKTFLSQSVRNVNRFYRATEDFYRRVYRLREITPRVIYRMRLMNNGLNNVGIIHENDDGEQYFFVPMDNVIYSAINPFLTVFSGGSLSMMQPQFNNFTGKVIGLNPSFQDDAGIPYLSGPIAGLAVSTLKTIAGRVFGTSPWVEQIDNVLLGDIGDNIDAYKAVTPLLLQRLHKALDFNENARHNHSSVLQAIAFNAAFEGLKHPGMKPDATPEERQDYLDIVRIGAHNTQVINAFLGTVLPFSTQTQESMNLSDHWRETGTTTLRQPYFEILDAIIKKYGDDVQDPYELAKALFVGKNPGKLAYTVSREDKLVKPLLQRTDKVQAWLISNKRFLETYGDAAYLFVPQDKGEPEINPAIYAWMEAAGLTSNVDQKVYLRRMNTLNVKQRYFNISNNLQERLNSVVDPTERKALIDAAEQERKDLKMAYPLLRKELKESGDIDVETEEEMYKNLKEIYKDNDAPISASQRKLLGKMLNIFSTGYAQMSIDPGYTSAGMWTRLAAKTKTKNTLTKIAGDDLFLNQLNKLVFFELIDFKVRDSYRAEPVR